MERGGAEELAQHLEHAVQASEPEFRSLQLRRKLCRRSSPPIILASKGRGRGSASKPDSETSHLSLSSGFD